MRKPSRRTHGASQEHDHGYKRLFSDPTLVEELLRGFLTGDWLERLDFSSLQRVGNSFVADDLRERHSDIIWRLRLRGDEDRWVYLYLLLEFQSTSDPFMAVRVLTYVGLLLEEIIRREKLKPGDRLPLVLPVVLHSGKGRWRGALRLESLFVPVPRELRRYLPRLTYLLLDERRLNLDRPELARNRVAALFRIETNADAAALPALSQALDQLVPPRESELRRTVQAWFTALVRRVFPDAIIPEGINLKEAPMLEETLVKWRDEIRKEALQEGRKEGRQEGRQEGRREGRHEGQVLTLRKMLLQQLTLRFGRLPKTVRSRVEQISSTQELEKLTRKVLTASSLEEMGIG
jgi:predicted transposase/invertase (TIGR01784 family)